MVFVLNVVFTRKHHHYFDTKIIYSNLNIQFFYGQHARFSNKMNVRADDMDKIKTNELYQI